MMNTATELGGFFAAHAIWCVSEGDPLVPMLAYSDSDGQKNMERFVNDDLQAAVATGKQRLADNDMDANDAALLYDGRITIEDNKIDAIIVEMRSYFSPDSLAVLAVPYTPKDSGDFRVHKPKLIAWENCEDFDMNAAFEAFFKGVAGHEDGAKVWDECLDESR